jgi:hypothetical protein
MLAITLGNIDSAIILLQHEANVNTENTQGWNSKFVNNRLFLSHPLPSMARATSTFTLVPVVQEAVGTGNPILLQMVLARRDYQRYCNRVAGIPELLHKLKQVNSLNFYSIPEDVCALFVRQTLKLN